MADVSALVEAKSMYVSSLCDVIVPAMLMCFTKMYGDAVKANKGRRNGNIVQFQNLLKEVPTWGNAMVKTNTDAITSTCPWFDSLVEAVFASVVRILSSIRTTDPAMAIKIPPNTTLVHRCYVNMSEDLYGAPLDIQENTAQSIAGLTARANAAVNRTIKELTPMGQILQSATTPAAPIAALPDVVNEIEEEDEPAFSDEEEEEALTPATTKHISTDQPHRAFAASVGDDDDLFPDAPMARP